MINSDKDNIPLGNLQDKVVYYNVESKKFYFTYLNNDNKEAARIASFAVLGYIALKLLNGVIVFTNTIIKLIALLGCYVISIKIAKKLFAMDNPEQEKKELYEDEINLRRLLIGWKKKTIIAMVILSIALMLNLCAIYYFFINGSMYTLFLYSVTIILLEVGNIDVLKRFKLLKQLIKIY